ncbi:hypothetical protein B0H17DRAFT_1203519 [Mycena rosella]|uniref:Uncharacterized protein n=1 Tax=Mycena rosella TaxID=1033263 RepID=A0AAD7DBB1_MYCRO|nr:hypothetical protein B0H17DRAFT_1203519 [Mycena rosella]
MDELERLCSASPFSQEHVDQPSRMGCIVASLDPLLRAQLPKGLFEMFHIPAADESEAVPFTRKHAHRSGGGPSRSPSHSAEVEMEALAPPSGIAAKLPLQSITPLATRKLSAGRTSSFVEARHLETRSERARVAAIANGRRIPDPRASRHFNTMGIGYEMVDAPGVHHPNPSYSISPTARSVTSATVPAVKAEGSLQVIPAPAIVHDESTVELGGLKESHQLAISHSETHTSENLRSKGSPTPSSSIPATGLFEDEDQVELGGLEHSHQPRAIPNLEIRTVKRACAAGSPPRDDYVGTLPKALTLPAPARAMEGSAVELGELALDCPAEYLKDVHGAQSLTKVYAVVRPSRGILKLPAPAILDIEAAVELGGLKDPHKQLHTADLKTRTSDECSRASKYDPLVLRESALPSSTASPAPTLVSDEAAVELGGPLPLRNERLANVQATNVLNANAHASFVSQSHSLLVFHSAQATGALISANMRILWVAYPEPPLFGDVVPDTGWEREGIGTRVAFDLAGAGARRRI